MADLRKFAGNMEKVSKTISKNVDRTVRRCALAIDATVVLATPVDTGRARSNWQVELGHSIDTTREPYSEGSEGSTAGPNARAAIEQGRTAIAAYKANGTNASIHITNNLSYIGKLNDGHSAQAPAGFVEEAVMVGVNAVRSAGSIITGTVKEE